MPRVSSSASAPTSARPAGPANDFEVLQAGHPPRRRLRYQFQNLAHARYWVVTHVALSDEEGSSVVDTKAPLDVAATGRRHEGFATLRVSLGPLEVQRSGKESPVTVEDDGSVLRAELDIDDRGLVRATRNPGTPVSGAVAAAWESLLELDELPDAAVGVGARWKRTRRLGEEAASLIESESELIAVRGDTLTLRVWRKQQKRGVAESSLRTVGEWTIALSSWPPIGTDHVHSTPLGDGQHRLESSFGVFGGATER